jgi:hypothetical protein
MAHPSLSPFDAAQKEASFRYPYPGRYVLPRVGCCEFSAARIRRSDAAPRKWHERASFCRAQTWSLWLIVRYQADVAPEKEKLRGAADSV